MLVESYDVLGQPDEQITYLRQQIGLESWHETAHRQLMALLAQQGQRPQALAQYETCRRILAEELGVDPSAETITLYQLIQADRLPKEVVLTQTAVLTHNLPAATTTFIGRETQLTELCEQLTQPETRLVTIAGLAGTGKTRLAQATASRLLSHFPQGVWFAPLAGLKADAAEIEGRLATAVLSQLHVDIPTNQEPFVTLCDFLHHKELLLVLDNLEHLLPAATAVIVELLNRAPHLTILATSQVRLNCQAETLHLLDGLAVPAGMDDEAMAAESVQLFVERAQRHYPGFALVDDDWAQMATLCHLLEGLPLAIELAASLVVHYSLAEIIKAIEQNLNVLATTMQDLPQRHRTLRAAFRYTWQLLAPAEQRVLTQLSLFPGEFTREAALAVTDATLTDLMALVNHSLLRLVTPGRYGLHSLISQFTTEMLADKPEIRALAQARYGRYYLTFLQRQMTFLDTHNETQALLALSREIDNIRPVWRRLTARADWEGIRTAMPGLMNFHNEMGWHQEGLSLVAEALQQLPLPDGEQEEVLAQLHCWQAIFEVYHGRYLQAETQLRQLIPIFQKNDNAPFLALTLFTLGRLALRAGNFEEAYRWLRQALAHYEALADKRGISQTMNQLGQYYERIGQFEEARQQYTACLGLNQRWRVPKATAVTLNNLGLLRRRTGEYAEAQALLAESIAIYQAMGNEFEMVTGLSNLALAKIELAAYDEARSLLQQAQQIQEKLGYCPRLTTVLTNLGIVANLQGRHDEAEVHLKESMHGKEAGDDEEGLAFSLVHLGQSYLGLHQYDKARDCFLETLQLTQKLALPSLALAAVIGLAELKAVSGNPVAALQLLQLPLAHAAAGPRIRRAAQVLMTEIEAGLEEEVGKTAVTAGQRLSLDEVTTKLLTERTH
jgi:predicted ATPase/Flp pilus assembly protein TadD